MIVTYKAWLRIIRVHIGRCSCNFPVHVTSETMLLDLTRSKLREAVWDTTRDGLLLQRASESTGKRPLSAVKGVT